MNQLNTTQITEMANANIESAIDAAQVALGGLEKALELNMKAAKTAIEQTGKNLKALANVKDPQEFAKAQTAIAAPGMESVMGYANAVYGIVSETANAFSKLAEEQIAVGNRQMHDAVEQFAKSAPAGSESSVAMVKSALQAANTAYETATKAAKQAMVTLEQNVQAATKAVKR